MPLSNPSLTVLFPVSNTVVRGNTAATINSVLLLSTNLARKGGTIWNNSNRNLYIEFGTACTTSAFAVKINPDGYYELPFNYTGSIFGIWNAADGSALVRELI